MKKIARATDPDSLAATCLSVVWRLSRHRATTLALSPTRSVPGRPTAATRTRRISYGVRTSTFVQTWEDSGNKFARRAINRRESFSSKRSFTEQRAARPEQRICKRLNAKCACGHGLRPNIGECQAWMACPESQLLLVRSPRDWRSPLSVRDQGGFAGRGHAPVRAKSGPTARFGFLCAISANRASVG